MKRLTRLLVGNLKRNNNAVACRQAEGALKEPASEAQTKIPREN